MKMHTEHLSTEEFEWESFSAEGYICHVIDDFDITTIYFSYLCSLDNNESLVNYQVLPNDVLECRVSHVTVT